MKIVSDCFNFVTTMLSYQLIISSLKIMSISQERRQNFGSGGHSARMYSSKTLKNFEKFIKKLAQNFKKFSKIFQT